MNCFSKSIYEFFNSIYHDFIKSNSLKFIIITYLLATATTISYGTYCMVLHLQQDSCWITFTIGVLLLMFLVLLLFFSIIANCMENSLQPNLQIRTRNPIN